MRGITARNGSRGSIAMEMAFVLPFLMAMIYGIIETARLLYTVAALNFAVEQASRCAAIDGCANTASGTPQCYAAHSAYGLGLQCDAFSYNSAASCGSTGSQVSISYTFQTPLLEFLPGGNSLSIPLYAQSCFPQ
jgi:TadE-like protein